MSEATIYAENWAAEMRWKMWGRHDLRYKVCVKFREKLIIKFVWALPHEIIRWALVRVVAHATSGKWGMTDPSSITAFTVMDRWEKGS